MQRVESGATETSAENEVPESAAAAASANERAAADAEEEEKEVGDASGERSFS